MSDEGHNAEGHNAESDVPVHLRSATDRLARHSHSGVGYCPVCVEHGARSALDGVRSTLQQAIADQAFLRQLPETLRGVSSRLNGEARRAILTVADSLEADMSTRGTTLGGRPCECYDQPGQDCFTAGPEVIAAEGLCGPCAERVTRVTTPGGSDA